MRTEEDPIKLKERVCVCCGKHIELPRSVYCSKKCNDKLVRSYSYPLVGKKGNMVKYD